MSEKVRIPFKFVVKKVTWRPAGEALPDHPQGQVLLTQDGRSFPVDVDLHPDPATLDALIEQGRLEYYAEKAAKVKEAREAEAAQWEPMPVAPRASRLTAALYGNLRQRK